MNETKTTGADKVTDPVCGMAIDPGRAAGMSRVAGKAFYFCSAGCNQKFDESPAMFTGAAAAPSGASCCDGASSPKR